MTPAASMRMAGAAWCCLVLLGCAGPSPSGPGDTGAELAAKPAQPLSFEQRERERALALTQQGRLADAALAWEVLTVLEPDKAEYRERLAETRRSIDTAAAERSQHAAQARRRGELDSATQQYLAVLALKPDDTAAADALRAIERERNKRAYLGKFSRTTLTRRAMADAEMAPPARAGAPAADRNEIEHASMLAGQGEYGDAISLLEHRLAADAHDRRARALLADVYFKKAETLAAHDRPAAIAALERSVKLDPAHARAAARLKQLKAARNTAAASAAGSAAMR